jgi:hypothetical protein
MKSLWILVHPWPGENRVCARDDAVRSVVPGGPVLKSGRGSCSAPWTVAFEHVEQIRLTPAAPLRAHALLS